MHDATPSGEPPRERRLRFSLLNLVMLMTIAALAFGVWRTEQRSAGLQREIERLRAEFGYVQVDDPSRLSFRVANESLDVYRHLRCRVYVPRGAVGRVDLRITNERPGRRSQGKCSMGLPPGESTFDLFVHKDAVGGRWRYQLSSPSPGISSGNVEGPMPPWFADDGKPLGMQFGRMSEKLDEGESAEILSRAYQRGDGSLVDLQLRISHEPAPTK